MVFINVLLKTLLLDTKTFFPYRHCAIKIFYFKTFKVVASATWHWIKLYTTHFLKTVKRIYKINVIIGPNVWLHEKHYLNLPLQDILFLYSFIFQQQ